MKQDHASSEYPIDEKAEAKPDAKHKHHRKGSSSSFFVEVNVNSSNKGPVTESAPVTQTVEQAPPQEPPAQQGNCMSGCFRGLVKMLTL